MDSRHPLPTGKIMTHCCPCGHDHGGSDSSAGFDRRVFLGGMSGAALGIAALSGLSWASGVQSAELPAAPPRKAIKVKPVFLYQLYKKAPQTSWRPWGGVQTEDDVQAEAARIDGELKALQSKADFPMEIAPLTATRNAAELAAMPDVQQADVLLVYACDGDLNQIAALKKDTVFFIRHKSGPVYLYYEIISPRFLRQHTDELQVPGMDNDDVVVDDYEEVLWRLRALCGLKNTRNARIVAVGGAGGWAQPSQVITDLVKKTWGLEILEVTYPDLKKMIEEARADAAAVALAEKRTEDYLGDPNVKLETDRAFLRNAFLLEHVFRKIMQQADCRMITVMHCMGTIMPVAETSACMALSTLNDDGYLAFCESDFVVIPSGILMASISGKPPFLNDPTYPHHGIITLAHCTAPRKMNGKDAEPVRVMTHFESDYGAAPKVEMSNGAVVTNILPDFQSRRWVGLLGEIVAHPLLPICRSQIDIAFKCDNKLLADRMPGFHWMTVYGDYLKEAAYAAKRVGIQVEILG